MENQKSIYELELHENSIIVQRINQLSSFTQTATRVPGGWIYRTTSGTTNGSVSNETFVPYSEEFKK